MKIQQISNEALLKWEKTTEVITATLTGLFTALLIAALFLCVIKQASVGIPLLMIPLSLSTSLLITIMEVGAVQKIASISVYRR